MEQAAAANEVVLVVATEAASVQRTWGNESLSLHDTLQQSKKLGMHMVVIPLEEVRGIPIANGLWIVC